MSEKLPIKVGCDYVRDKDWNIVKGTRAQAENRANGMATAANRRDNRPGFWHGAVCSSVDGKHWRINLASQPEI